jgi:hypothetical protein
MDAARRLELRQSLERSLQSDASEHNLDARAQMTWLAEHLDEYIDRWLGFCAVPSLQMADLLKSDLFLAVEVGAEMLGEHVGTSAPKAESAWKQFRSALEHVRGTSEKQDAHRLRDAFDAFRATTSVASER